MPKIRLHVRERKLPVTVIRGVPLPTYGHGWPDGLIEVDPRQSSQERMDTLLHEAFHIFFPKMKHGRLVSITGQLTIMLWRQGYRRVHR